MSAQKSPALIRARKRLDQLKKKGAGDATYGDKALVETFERPDAHIGKKVEEMN